MNVWPHLCMCTTCKSGALRGQNKELDLLEQELEVGASLHRDARNQTQVFSKCSRFMDH